ncbi:MAG: response regulator [Spirochaetales bacterium]|nr:response regulator [Spirochaetales bacterium]
MTRDKKSGEDLRHRIAQALRNGVSRSTTGEAKSIDELVQDIHIYYQELEFQNDELERVRAELESSNRKYEDLFMNAPMGYVTFDESYRVRSMNRKLCTMLGVVPEQTRGLRLDTYIHPDSQDSFYLHCRSLLQTTAQASCRLVLKGSSRSYSSYMESNLLEESGERFIRSTIVDMSQEDALTIDLASTRLELERKNYELQEYHDRLEATMLAGNLAWWRLDINSGEVLFNEQKTRMLGYAAEDFKTYQDFARLVHEDDYEPMMNAMRKYLDGHTDAYRCEYRIRASNNEYHWFQDIGVASAHNPAGRPIALFGVAIDTTEIKAMQLEAQRANAAKSEFLAHMSHEIRTPLNAIIGFTEMLRSAPLEDEYREYLDNAHDSARTLMDIVNDLLDLSKIEAGRLELDEISSDIPVLLRRVVSMFKTTAVKKGLDLSLAAPPSLPATVTVDPLRLKQVLINLIGNAIKFTDRGSVRLSLTCSRDQSDGTCRLTFSVRDTGIGVTEDEKRRLFKAFSQADASITRRFGGTGLGLVISSALIRKMGGELTMNSEPGSGSEFSFTLTKRCDESTAPAPDAPEQDADDDIHAIHHAELTILLAEDVKMNRTLVESMLKRFLPNATLLSAADGEEAVRLFRKTRPDLVLMDIQMPVMDGYTATAAIREYEKKVGATKPALILALTAGTLSDELGKSSKAGMDGYLAKPIDFKAFFKAIHDSLGLTMSQAEAVQHDSFPPATTSIEPAAAHFDLEALLGVLDDDTELAAQMIDMSLVQFAEYKDDLGRALRDGEGKAAHKAAHKFKGAAATMACAPLAAILADMEAVAAGESMPSMERFAAMEAELDLVLSAMRDVRGRL